MTVYIRLLWAAVGIFLIIAFTVLFYWFGRERLMRRMLIRTYDSIAAAARHRDRENRRQLLMWENQEGFLYTVQRRLVYSGIAGRFRFVTPEVWITVWLILCGFVYSTVFLISRSQTVSLCAGALTAVFLYLWENHMIQKNDKAVNDNLMKFLDFLGSYSLTAGEVTGVLGQISRYLEDPLKRVLDECYYEAQTSGDPGLALLSMAAKIRHPKFKEIVRNMEISLRYSADFTVLVNNSRRSLREYMRTGQERRTMLNEAIINMLLLGGMSCVVLLLVERLVGASVKEILLYSLPGKVSMGIAAGVAFGMYRQLQSLEV